MAFPTIDDPPDRVVSPRSPLPCQAWHGYGVSSAHDGEVRGCRRACERTPSGAAAAAPPAGAAKMVCVAHSRADLSLGVVVSSTLTVLWNILLC
jgi:hypothetical protein